jgi:hypothetical protein
LTGDRRHRTLRSKWQEERKARIERVNAQLRNFYGPLLAAVSATKSAYDALITQHSPDGSQGAFQDAVCRGLPPAAAAGDLGPGRQVPGGSGRGGGSPDVCSGLQGARGWHMVWGHD